MKKPAQVKQDPNLVEHEETYKAFNILLRWCMVALGSFILATTMMFASSAGVFASLVVGLVVFALGYLFLVRQEESTPLDAADR
jgi:hypothetical protein